MSGANHAPAPELVLCVECGWETDGYTQEDIEDGETPRCVECEAHRAPEGEP